MLPENLINALKTLSNSGKPLVTSSIDSSTGKATKPLEPGQQFQASVLSKIGEGLFKVQVAGQMLQMRLPNNIRSGDTIKLEVLAIQPRITFGMVASTNPLSTPEKIGAMARLLSNLAELPLERPVIQQLGNNAIWPMGQTTPDIKLIAGSLREALEKSGLFYESHQLQWIRGELSTRQLLEEPQNILIKEENASASDQIKQPVGYNQTEDSGAPQSSEWKQNREILSQTGSADNNKASTNINSDIPINKELLNIVQQQLHALEHHHLIWQGLIWPGQEMKWEIQGEPERKDNHIEVQQWSTDIELALPHLGDIHARILLSPQGVRLALHAADPTTIDLFNRTLPSLRKSFDDAKISLISTSIEKS